MSGAESLRHAAPGDLAAVQDVQRRAYAPNREILGVEPLPLLADYAEIFKTHEVWLAERDGVAAGVLILQEQDDHLLVWSVATAPQAQGLGLGRLLLAFAEQRAGELGRTELRLYTGERLTQNIAWYGRHGYAVTAREALVDRTIVHMSKIIGRAAA